MYIGTRWGSGVGTSRSSNCICEATPGRSNGNERSPARFNEQNLFAIEEIAEDTRFVTDISFDELKAAHLFHKTYDSLLKGDLWLTVGRGGRPVRVVDACWVEERVRPDLPADGKIVFTLFSDLIARGPLLGFQKFLDPKMLIELAVDEGKERGELLDTVWDWELKASDHLVVRGFNSASGLPRMPAVAVRRGSTIIMRGPANHAKKLYQALAKRAALGERTHEGFGQFRLDAEFAELAPVGEPQPDRSLSAEAGKRAALLREAKLLAETLKSTPSSSLVDVAVALASSRPGRRDGGSVRSVRNPGS